MYTPQQLRYLDAMGIPAWVERHGHSPTLAPTPVPAVSTEQPAVVTHAPVATTALSFADWLGVQSLAQTQSQATTKDSAVYLSGPTQSRLLVIADHQIETATTDTGASPFSGQSARLLQAMLQAIGLKRAEVLIGTTAASASAAGSSVADTISTALQGVDAAAVRAVLFYTYPGGGHGYADMDELRDGNHKLEVGVPCVVSYHPAWLLEHTELKRAAWNDLKRVRQLLN